MRDLYVNKQGFDLCLDDTTDVIEDSTRDTEVSLEVAIILA